MEVPLATFKPRLHIVLCVVFTRSVKIYLQRLRHENLINLIEVFRRRRKLFLVFEYVDHTVLEELEEYPKGLAGDTARSHVFQVLRGIEFCHMNNVSMIQFGLG
jgi:serine/threonine protein kinase